MYCSIPGFPVLYYLPEFTQVHVHWVSDAILPSHPLSMYMLSLPEFFPFPFLPPEIASVYTAEIMVVGRESLDLHMGLSASLKILLGLLSNGCSCPFDRCSSCQCSQPKTAGQIHSLPSLGFLWTYWTSLLIWAQINSHEHCMTLCGLVVMAIWSLVQGSTI